MAWQSTIDVLNRILALHSRSLPQYLTSARAPGRRLRTRMPSRPCSISPMDQRLMVERIASVIMAEGGCPYLGEYPMSFTGMHDLSVDYLVREVAARQKQDVATMRECIAQLQDSPVARAVAEEALGAAEAHLQNLEELAQPNLSVVSPHSP